MAHAQWLMAGVLATAVVTGACSPSGASPTPTSSSSSAAPDPAPSTSAPAPPSPSPTPAPTPVPTPNPAPIAQGTARGAVIFVQQFGDAALVAGGDPIRLTMTQTEGLVSWFSAPRQRLTGVMRTTSMLRLMGWQPSADGRTSDLPARAPNAFLSASGATLAMSVKRASVRGDGTLVLDIAPIASSAETTPEFGAGSVVFDGVAGVRSFVTQFSEGLSVRTVVLGRRAQLALVQFLAPSGQIIDEYVLTPATPTVSTGDIGGADLTIEAGAALALQPPTRDATGSLTLTGSLTTDDGTVVPMDVVLARWTRPAR